MTLEYVYRPEIIAPDYILCRGQVHRITHIVRYAPGEHPTGCPIVATLHAVEYRTAVGSRWFGARERP